MKKLDPTIHECETQEQAYSYDRWYRAKVQEAIDSDKPRIPHDEIINRMKQRLAKLKTK